MTNSEESLKLKNFYKKNNIKCFLNVLNYCVKNKSKLIHISSTSIYNESSKNIEENIKNLKPKSPYSKIKLYEEKTLIKNNDRIKYTSLRFGTIVGVSRGMRFHTAVNKFCFNTIMRIPLPVWSTAFNQYRPYLSIKDAFKTIKFIIEKVLAIYYDYNLESVVWNNTHVSFHKINKDTVVNDIHKDTDAVLAGVIYLNKTGDLTNGTTIYEDKKEILKIANHFNSMVCYDAKQLHGITNSFLKEEERLVIVFFIDILEVNLTPLERCNRVQNEF
jgi:hypothetical protein